jgi:hypothetical protein
MFRQPLRAGGIRQIARQNGFEQWVATRNRVAHHIQIGIQVELFDVIAFDQLDTLLSQLRAHRRIDIGIAPRHPMSGGARQQRDATHEGAANPENVQMHGVIPWNNGRGF